MALGLDDYKRIYDSSGITTRDQFIKECKRQGATDSDAALGKYYDDRKKAEASNANRRSSTGLSVTAAAGGIASITGLGDVFESTSRFGRIGEKEQFGVGDFMSSLLTGGSFKDIAKTALSKPFEEIGKQLELESQLRTDINEKTGLAGDLSKAYRDTILDSLPAVTRLGYGISDLTDFQETLMNKSGRFNLVSRETLEKSAETARAFVGDMGDMAELMGSFEQVGIGATKTISDINKLGKGSLELGLNARQTVKDIKDNVGKLNEYGFKNGIQGLAEMSRKAKEFRMDMGEVFKIADKVMSPEGAIDLAANLQVLGGAIGDFADPLKMMYDATNNVEGLQDALIGAAGSLATYNSEQGRFEITGVNLRRAKEMASQLGISYQELAKGAIASQERMMASSALMAKGLDLPEKDKEFITNLSRMEDGKMVISIPESLSDKFLGKTQLTLDELTKEQIDVLQENKKAFEKMSPEDIARDQFEAVKNIQQDLNAYLIAQRRGLTREARKDDKDGGLSIDKTVDTIEKAFRQEITQTFGKKQAGEIFQMVDFKSQIENLKEGKLSIGTLFTVGMDKIRESVTKSLNYKENQPNQPNQTNQTSNINLNVTSDVTTDIMARNLLRSDQVWQDIFTRNPRDYTTIGL